MSQTVTIEGLRVGDSYSIRCDHTGVYVARTDTKPDPAFPPQIDQRVCRQCRVRMDIAIDSTCIHYYCKHCAYKESFARGKAFAA